MKYDVESYFDSIVQFFKDNFNDKIDQINTEKNDSIVLSYVNESDYALQTMSEKCFNSNQFLFIGITNIDTTQNGSALDESVSIEIVIVLTDSYDNTIDKRLLRYQRAMKEIILDNYKKLTRDRTEVVIQSQVPIQFQVQNSDRHHKALGIEINKSIFT